MLQEQLDVTGIGNAIVDVISHAEDALLVALDLPKGGMTLIDEPRAQQLYESMGPAVEVSGGSAANTIAAVASLGGRAGYIGKVRKDQLGEVFGHDIRALGVHFRTHPAGEGAATARCLVLVTPDGQRTMGTYLGACVALGPEDIDAELIAASKVTYLEGYLWDPPRAKEAMRKATEIAHLHGRKVALSLSDAFCVERHRAELGALIQDHVDVLFANESELLSLTQQHSFEQGCAALRGAAEVLVLTRGPKGAVILSGSQSIEVRAEPVGRVVDTTGAGDLYAAGFLYGYTHGKSLSESGRIGAVCAAEVISHLGARPATSLKELLAQRPGPAALAAP